MTDWRPLMGRARPYVCLFCGREFYGRVQKLVDHFERQHGRALAPAAAGAVRR